MARAEAEPAPAGQSYRAGLFSRLLSPNCLLPTAYCLLPLLFFAPYLGGRIMPFGADILVLNYPLMSLLAHALRTGHALLWNPYSGGGYPLAPFSALPFYPPSWLLAVLPVTGAMSWTYVLDLMIGGLGAYALAARLGVSLLARMMPAVVFPFSGFVLAHIYAGHFLEVGLILWLPATLAALHWAAEAPSVGTALRRGLLCGGPLGMMILANGVSWLVFVDYPVGLVALVLIVRAARQHRSGGPAAMLRAAARPLAALVAAGVVAGLLGAAVALPLRDLLGATVRGEAMSYDAVTRISATPASLAMALAPGIFGFDPAHTYWFANSDAYFQEVYAYIGLLPLALALAGAMLGRRRPYVLLYAALAVLGVVLALGAHTPLYGLLYHVVPGLDLARVPARWLLMSVLALAVLSGVGADAVIGAARRPSISMRGRLTLKGHGSAWRLQPHQPAAMSTQSHASTGYPVPLALAALALLLVLGLICGVIAAMLPAAAHHGATIAPALARLLVVACASALAVLAAAQVPRPAGASLLLLVTLADLWSANGPLVRPLDPAPYYGGSAVDLAHAQAGGGRVWALDRSIPLRLGMLDRRTRDVQDFAPLTLSDYWLLTHPGRSLAGVDTGTARAVMGRYNERVAALLGVSLVVSPQPLHDTGLVPLARLRVPHWGILNGDWSHPGAHPGPAYAYRVTDALPFALPVYATRTARGHVPLAQVFAPGFDARRVALLDGGPVLPSSTNALLDAWRRTLIPARSPSSGGTAAGPGVTITGSSENGALLRATMRSPGVLLLDQVYDPGWTAMVDGRPVPLRRADYLLTALPLSGGTHSVTLVYAPPSYLTGALLTLLGYVVLIGAAGIALRRR